MKKYLLIIICFLLISFPCCSEDKGDGKTIKEGDTKNIENQYTLLPFKIPKLPQLTQKKTDIEEIKKIITALKEIDSPDIGLSSTMGGFDFPPVAGMSEWRVGIIMNHNLIRNRALTRLVELGPTALPILIEHLTDKTPTKLVIKHEMEIGAMWYDQELPINPVSKQEVNALNKAGLPVEEDMNLKFMRQRKAERTNNHTIKIGEVCFAIVGMIANRSYQAVRYQPTACIVLNSPIKNNKLTIALQNMWNMTDIRQALFKHLLIDLYTRRRGKDFQCGAAMRLLYYFPEQAVPLIVERINGFKLENGEIGRNHYKLNGTHVIDYLEAVSWHTDHRLKEAIRTFIQPSKCVHIIAAGAPAMIGAETKGFFQKLTGMLMAQDRKHGSPQMGLKAIWIVYPHKTSEVFQKYLRTKGEDGAKSLILFFQKRGSKIAPEVLAPVLNIKSIGYSRYLKEGLIKKKRYSDEDFLDHRLCDNAYVLICQALGDPDTVCMGTYQEMDKRIKELQVRLKSDKKGKKFTQEELKQRDWERKIAERKLQKEREVLGEAEFLIKQALPKDKNCKLPDSETVKEIATKYPESIIKLYHKLLKDHPHLQSHQITRYIVSSKFPLQDKIQSLLEGAKHDNLYHRSSALSALYELKYEKLNKLIIDGIENLPVAPKGYYFSCEAVNFTCLVLRVNDPKVLESLKQKAKSVDVGTRLEILKVISRRGNKQFPVKSRISFLKEFLNDTTIRIILPDIFKFKSKFRGPCAGRSFPRLEVRNFATTQLADLLNMESKPEPSWTPEQWKQFRAEVNKKLKEKGF